MKFIFKQSVQNFIRNYLKLLFFKKITKNGLNLFFRNQDIISPYPMVSGAYEEHIKNFIIHFSNEGFSDFLIDIGANIGLISCQTGEKFRQIHMFEPNPDCFKILEVNSKIALRHTDYFLYNFGLGEEDGIFELFVPQKNWGGGYIKHESNPYNEEILANKDKSGKTDKNTYAKIQVKIKNAWKNLGNLFDTLAKDNLANGIIKIDVEGLEISIIRAIAKSVPENFNLIIVFESWNENININSIVEDFEGRAKTFKFSRTTLWNEDKGKISKIFSLLGFFLRKSAITHQIEETKKGEFKGNLIIQINKKKNKTGEKNGICAPT